MTPDMESRRIAAIGKEIAAASDVLEALGVALCQDRYVARNFGVVLQSIDELAQRHRALGEMLERRGLELNDFGLETLAARPGTPAPCAGR